MRGSFGGRVLDWGRWGVGLWIVGCAVFLVWVLWTAVQDRREFYEVARVEAPGFLDEEYRMFRRQVCKGYAVSGGLFGSPLPLDPVLVEQFAETGLRERIREDRLC